MPITAPFSAESGRVRLRPEDHSSSRRTSIRVSSVNTKKKKRGEI